MQNINVWIVDGKDSKNAAISVGYSIIKRTAKSNVGKIMLSYGGGGHHQAGTCHVPYGDCDRVVAEIVPKLLKN